MASRSAARSGCAGSVSDGRLSSTNASWNGRQDAAAAPRASTAACASAYAQALLLAEPGDRGVPALQRHRPVGEPERGQRVGVAAARSGSVSSAMPARIRVAASRA